MRFRHIAFLVLLSYANCLVSAQTPPVWVTEGALLNASSGSFEVPLEVMATKMYVEVEIGNTPRRFVIDTGSPSMIDSAIVDELGLQVVGTNKGRDAHGAIVETEVVQTDLRIGGMSVERVSMMVADFSSSAATNTFIDDGVLGSDLLPLGAWQLDLRDSVLRFNTDVDALPNIKNAKQLTLYQFGYPNMPIFDVRFAKKARSKAMLDTGSPTLFTISSQDLAGAEKASGVGRAVYGYGSPGSSLGGQAPNSELLQVELKNLSIDKLKLGPVVAVGRDLSPSLIGAKILEHFIVTLDSRSEIAYFTAYSEGIVVEPSFGFSLAYDNGISVAAVWDGSPAKAAGLRVGLELISINGEKVEYSRQGILRAVRAMEGEEIELAWDGGSAKLTRQRLFPAE